MKYLFLILILVIMQCSDDIAVNEFNNNNINPDPNKLCICYLFNGNANNVLEDDHHGVVLGATLSVDRFGKENSAYYFDGVDDLIRFNINVDGWSERTLNFWLKTDQTKRMYIGGWGQDAVYGEQITDINKEPGKFQTTLWDGDEEGELPLIISEPVTLLTDDAWHNITVKYKLLDSMCIYIDGIKDTSIYVEKLGDPNDVFEIGRYYGLSTNYFHGYIDDIRIYNYSLTDQEIKLLYYR